MSAQTREALGKRIRELREANHLSQEKFALMVNVERSYLSKVEKGARNPSIDCVEKIAGGFGMSLEELFAGFENPQVVPAGNAKPRVRYESVPFPSADGDD